MKTIKIGSTKLTGCRVDTFKIPVTQAELERCADRLRGRATKSEKALKHQLTKRGHEFLFQHPLHGYIADFYFAHKNLVVELDGQWHRLRPEKDALRDKRLGKHGIKTLRIESDRVFSGLASVLREIENIIGSPKMKKGRKKRQRVRQLDDLTTQFLFATQGL